jgi:SAM-dependent methyltransferase
MESRNEREYYNQAAVWDNPGYDSQELIQAIERVLPGGIQRILDVGCGSGTVVNHFARQYRTVGADMSGEALRRVIVDKVMASGGELPFASRSMDLVLLSNVLEHLPDLLLKATIQEAIRVAKHYILVVSPYREHLSLAQVKCDGCGTIYHMNYHLRSISLPDVDQWFSGEFQRVAVTYWGNPWLRYDSKLWAIRQQLGDGWCRWPHALCPSCGMKSESVETSLEKEKIRNILDEINAEWLSLRYDEVSQTPLECEIAALFIRVQRETPVSHPLVPIQANVLQYPERVVYLPVPTTEVPVYGAVRFTARHLLSVDCGDLRRVQGGTGSQDICTYFCINEHAVWSDRTLEEGRIVRRFQYSTDMLRHGIFIVPRSIGRSCFVTIVYRDKASGSIGLYVYEQERGYLLLGHLEARNDGQWKETTFAVPESVLRAGHGIQFNLTGDLIDPESYLAIQRIVVNGHDHLQYEPVKPELVDERGCRFLVLSLPPLQDRHRGYEWFIEVEWPTNTEVPKGCYGLGKDCVVGFSVTYDSMKRVLGARIPIWWNQRVETSMAPQIETSNAPELRKEKEQELLQRTLSSMQTQLDQQARLLDLRLVRGALSLRRAIRQIRCWMFPRRRS